MKERLTWWTKLFAASGLAGVAVFALLVSGPLDRFNAARERQSHLEDDYRVAYFLSTRVDLLRERMPTLKYMLERLTRLLPDAAGVEVPVAGPDVLVRAAAARSRIRGYDLSIADSVARDFYAERQFTIRANGQYRELAEFLRHVSSGSGELIVLRQVSLAPSPDTRQLALDVSATAFAYLSDDAVATLRKAKQAAGTAGAR
jgi:Tfp pilus assembly protein PilO